MSKNSSPSQFVKTFGPVADLEKHLPSDWWRNLFTSLYLKTDGDVVDNPQNTEMEVDALVNVAKLKPTDTILDLCCGQGRHVLELYGRGYTQVVGLDRSRYLIQLAKKRADKLKFKPAFSEGDARKIRLKKNSVNCVVIFGNSFGYFERREDDEAVLNSIKNVLTHKGRLVMDLVNGAWMKENYKPRSWEWIDGNHFVCRERSLSQDTTRLIAREVIVHGEKGVIADQFYAERLYTFDEIKNLLESVGFTDVVMHNEMFAFSDRKQDLGLMENRMFLSCVGPEKIRSTTTRALTPPDVLVLLGDPKIIDKVKRDGKFNEEDIDTVARLKKGLADLKEYKFQYLDNHNKLFTSLQQVPKPDLVFNLCDEGFRNDATKELHIPALLEMLEIPYTGSPPECLAMCYNKSVVRSIAHSLDIPVPEETYVDSCDQVANLPSIFPALIKPNCGDSSIGITKDAVVYSSEELISYIDQLKTMLPNVPILIQEYLSGNEYSVAIIGNPGNYTILPILQVDYSHLAENLPKILSYESKWLPDSPYWSQIKYIEANAELWLERQLVDHSTLLFERLGCRDYARFDFRTDKQGRVKLLEVNPNPGWCWDGKLNYMAEFAGKKYSELLDMIISAAQVRLSSSANRSSISKSMEEASV